MAFYHSIILSFNHSIIQSFNLSFYHSIIQSFNHSIYHSIILSFYHSSNQAIKQSSNQAIKQSSNQAIKQRYHNFYRFYKNLFKNPLFFIILSIILSLINPHRNLFKKFDSISPIFKPVGLTELNSKER